MICDKQIKIMSGCPGYLNDSHKDNVLRDAAEIAERANLLNEELVVEEPERFPTRDNSQNVTPNEGSSLNSNSNDAALDMDSRGSDIRTRNVADVRQASLHLHRDPRKGQDRVI